MDKPKHSKPTSQAARILGYLKDHRRLIIGGLFALVVTDILGLVPPWLIKDAIDALPGLSSRVKLLPYLGAIILVAGGQAVFRFAWRRSLLGVARRAEYRLRNDLFRHLQGLDRGFFLTHPVGDLMSRCTNDLTAIQEFIAYSGLLIVDSCITIGTCLVLMVVIDPVLTLACLIPMPLLSIAFFYFGRRVRGKSAEVQEALAGLTQVVQETVVGIRTIQAYTLEPIRQELYRDSTDRYIRRNLDLARIRGLFYASLTFLAGLAIVIVLWVGGTRVVGGHLSLGGFVGFSAYLTMIIWPMMSFGFMVNLLQRGRASLARLEEVFHEEPAIEDPPHPKALSPGTREIHFQGVSFRYPGSTQWVLHDLSFRVPAGAKVGVTGPVGSGKSTLLELIPRIYDPGEGGVFLDGRDVREVSLRDLRRQITVVAQEPFLFSESIAANMGFGNSGYSAEEVERVARLVRLDKDREAFPQGWETLVGERGVTLSGGQRQRVALARALMTAPRILLLDDAFSHLDEETESEIVGNLLEALPQTTIVFTSHRISSLRRADRVVVLGDGKLLQEGDPSSLAETRGYFRRIWQEQHVLRELERVDGEGQG